MEERLKLALRPMGQRSMKLKKLKNFLTIDILDNKGAFHIP
jgi:hypothetical protein